MMKITTMAIFLSVFTYAQKSYTINGIVKDKDTGERIAGATIKVKENPEITVETNEYGFYSLSLPENDYTLIISHNKHKEENKSIHLNEALKIDLALAKDDTLIEEVALKGKKKTAISQRNKMGADVLDIQSIAKLPVLFGERDVIKTIQFLPGISSQEGRTGFSVRGGEPDQNLILLDEAPVFNNSHLLGFFSTFNNDALKDVTVYKGNMPSQYGGRLSSIIDVKMKDGNNENFGVSGGIGLISSRLTVEGPLQKKKSSFMVSARRTYADIFLKGNEENGLKKLYFYDLNAKLNYQINKNNGIYFSGYMGRDVLEIDKYKNNYGNLLGTLRWNSVLSSKLFSNTSIIYSNYDYKTKFSDGALSAEENPNIKNWIFKQDFTHYADPKHTFRYGIQASHYDFYTKSKTKEDLPTFLAKDRSMWENSVYFNDDYKVTDKFFINYGLRLSMLSSGKNNTYLESSGNDFKDNYLNLEPRLMLKYDFNDKNSIRTGYTRNTQNIQTLGTNGTDLTNDIWINLRKPEIADQVNFGYTRKLGDSYELNTEVFYKKMSNLVDYKDDIEGSLVDDLESNLLFNGKGRAYGLEIMAKKTRGRFTGWVSYTLSKSQRKIDGINDGEWYNARYDRTHNLSIVANYDLSPRWSLSGAFVYNTGNAVTLPVGKYEIDSQTYLQYGKRNDGRMPAYHRMDLNLTYESSSQKRFKSSWSFGVYNVYGRKNAYRLSFEPDKNNPEKINTMKTSLFSFVPNVTYNFKF